MAIGILRGVSKRHRRPCFRPRLPPGRTQPHPPERFGPKTDRLMNDTCDVLLNGLITSGIHGRVYWGELHMVTGAVFPRVAVKVIDADSCTAATELSILRMKLDSPYICAPVQHFKCALGSEVFVSDLLDVSLLDVIRRGVPFRQDLALHHLMQGLSELHSRSVMHCDLKSDNLMFKGGVLKLIDFGLSKFLDSDGTCDDTVAYAYTYKPPEVALDLRFGPPADTWAMGVVGFEMVTGRYPFEAESDHDLLTCFESTFKFRKGSLSPENFGNLARKPCLPGLLGLRPQGNVPRTPPQTACLSMVEPYLLFHPDHRAALPPPSRTPAQPAL